MHDAITGAGLDPGYRAPQVCKLVGITYRQLDHWARTDLLKPSLREADGSGTQRLYSFTDLLQLRVVRRLLDTGISLQKIRRAVDWLRGKLETDHPLTELNLISDGNTIWAKDHADEAAALFTDLLRQGQGVFGIAVGQVQRDLEGDILELFPPQARYEEEAPAAAAAN